MQASNKCKTSGRHTGRAAGAGVKCCPMLSRGSATARPPARGAQVQRPEDGESRGPSAVKPGRQPLFPGQARPPESGPLHAWHPGKACDHEPQAHHCPLCSGRLHAAAQQCSPGAYPAPSLHGSIPSQWLSSPLPSLLFPHAPSVFCRLPAAHAYLAQP